MLKDSKKTGCVSRRRYIRERNHMYISRVNIIIKDSNRCYSDGIRCVEP